MKNINQTHLKIFFAVFILAAFLTSASFYIINTIKQQLAKESQVRVVKTNMCTPTTFTKESKDVHFAGCNSLI